ncbi:MAG: hypothetical protein PHC83_08195 [Bacteroidales bacterium]|nr:hypothetical protein [Bacteroidales bacterium]MDD4208882.1 hypothetical protein [Bacteroidales bacterium]
MKDYVVNNFKAINYQYAVGQFSTCINLEGCSFETMMFEKYPSISPYTYCANNPVRGWRTAVIRCFTWKYSIKKMLT